MKKSMKDINNYVERCILNCSELAYKEFCYDNLSRYQKYILAGKFLSYYNYDVNALSETHKFIGEYLEEKIDREEMIMSIHNIFLDYFENEIKKVIEVCLNNLKDDNEEGN